ncbi:hypothetical protein PanWU01x14_142630 [Parasponia andersonii]|uniref:Uncharacterized protein n=1 Tax=Parasponia andersonii TaxID=3476 RepID=A0A2P5CLH9_PARAD|nr:hypothetical protein PanWU01x14_142630 [Parasponia andersonii]
MQGLLTISDKAFRRLKVLRYGTSKILFNHDGDFITADANVNVRGIDESGVIIQWDAFNAVINNNSNRHIDARNCVIFKISIFKHVNGGDQLVM